MRSAVIIVCFVVSVGIVSSARAQDHAIATSAQGTPQAQPVAPAVEDPIKGLIDRLDLESYKATIKGLTQFGDRRQGTDRNRAAVEWIEAQLKSFGCTNTERIKYVYQPPATPAAGRAGAGAGRGGPGTQADGGGTHCGRPRGP